MHLLYVPYENHRKYGHRKKTKCNRDSVEDNVKSTTRFKVAISPVRRGERDHSKRHDQAKSDNTQVDPTCDFAEFPLSPIVLDNK
jgi:hypothetical protein